MLVKGATGGSSHYIVTLYNYSLYTYSLCLSEDAAVAFERIFPNSHWFTIYIRLSSWSIWINCILFVRWIVPVWNMFATGAVIPWREKPLYYYSVVVLSTPVHDKKPFSASLINFESKNSSTDCDWLKLTEGSGPIFTREGVISPV